jgi:hypothetical protein
MRQSLAAQQKPFLQQVTSFPYLPPPSFGGAWFRIGEVFSEGDNSGHIAHPMMATGPLIPALAPQVLMSLGDRPVTRARYWISIRSPDLSHHRSSLPHLSHCIPP